MPDDDRFSRAIGEFNQGRYFECHDLLEAIWVDASGAEKRFLQGLIQVSVGFYHFGNDNPSGALSQWSKGVAKLSEFTPGRAGVDVSGLLDTVREWSRAAERRLGGGGDALSAPRTPRM